MANITGAFDAASQVIDAFVSTLHGPFPALRYTLEDSESFVESGSTRLMVNRAREVRGVLREAAWGEYRKDAYQTQVDESWCCQ
jgi:hypothetical protein